MSFLKQSLILSLFISLLSASSLHAGGEDWLTDFEKAKAIAKEENKPMLLDFTGSDWCGWCIKLKKEVFSKESFQTYAKDNLVLVELDFPSRKKIDKATEKQNYALQEKFGVKGYPTIILLDSEGEEVARTGYKRGGAEKYVEHLKALLAKDS